MAEAASFYSFDNRWPKLRAITRSIIILPKLVCWTADDEFDNNVGGVLGCFHTGEEVVRWKKVQANVADKS
jgi:hypothetical protein